jgi:Tol biopolymer transport system component
VRLRTGTQPALAGKLLLALAAMLSIGFLAITDAAAGAGRIAVSSLPEPGNRGILELVDPTGGGAQLFAGSPTGPSALVEPTWNKDGSAIAFYDAGKPPYGVWVKPLSGGPEYQLLPNVDTRPSWSPTSDEIAYWHQTQTPTGQLFESLRVSSGDGLVTRTIAGPYDAIAQRLTLDPPAWSPDGKSIAFIYRGNITSVPATGGAFTTLVAEGPGYDLFAPSFAPDGARLAYVKGFDNGMGQIHRFQLIVNGQAPPPPATSTRIGGGPETVITDQQETSWWHGPQSWSPDSKQIAYATNHCDGPTPAPCHGVLHVANSNGSGDSAVLERSAMGESPAWGPGEARPNYYVKHVEVAQALGPALPAPNPDNAETEGPIPLRWSVPSFGGYPLPLIAGRRTLLRIYVGDAKLDPGERAVRTVHYTVAIGGTTQEGDEAIDVTAPDRQPDQKAGIAAINAWIPAADAVGVIPHIEVTVNAGESETECGGCYPKGNRASVDGVAYEPGGDLTLTPVPIIVIDPDGTVRQPGGRFDGVWSEVGDFLPVREGLPLLGRSALSVVATVKEFKNVSLATCALVITQLEALRRVSTAPASEHWVAIAPRLDLGCNGVSPYGANVLYLGDPDPMTLVHELGHSLGLHHTLSLEGLPPPPEGQPLPYVGIGAVGYRGETPTVLNPGNWSDVMGYTHPSRRWTSPATWWRMHQAILGEVAIKSGEGSGRASASAGGAAGGEPRRLISGYLGKKGGEIFSSLLANVNSPNDTGPIAGRLVALDGHENVVAKAAVRGRRLNEGGGKMLPFVVALPPTPSAVSVELRTRHGGELATLNRSRHYPSARFLRLRHRARVNHPFTVRWKAADTDDDSLSVTLLARRGGVWRTVRMGPASFHARVRPSTIGRGKKLRLRLLVSDGFNTTTVKARPVTLR